MAIALGKRNTGRRVESCSDLWINLDVLIGLDCNSLIPGIDLCGHPFVELSFGEDAEDVHDPLFWKTSTLLKVIWHVSLQTIISVDVSVDLFEAESFILRHVTIIDFVLLEVFLLAADNVLEEI